MSNTLRILRKLLTWRTPIYGTLTAAVLLCFLLMGLQTSFGGKILADIFESTSSYLMPTTRLSIQKVQLQGWTQIQFENVELTSVDKDPALEVNRITINIWNRDGVPIQSSIIVDGPRVIVQEVEGELNWMKTCLPSTRGTILEAKLI